MADPDDTGPGPRRKPRKRPRGFVESWNPQAETRKLLAAVDQVLAEYAEYLPLTVRQIYYRLVGTSFLTKTQQAYDRLGEHLVMARRARRIPFEHIRDDGADLPWSLVGDQSGRDLAQTLANIVRYFDLDRQLDQPRLLLLWCEAAGMKPQLEKTTEPFGVKVISGGGFDSVTVKHAMAKMIVACGKPVEVLHVGDYDREGQDIFTALSEDVTAFVEAMGGSVQFTRLAVTPEQVTELGLPQARTAARSRPKRSRPMCWTRSSPMDCARGLTRAGSRQAGDGPSASGGSPWPSSAASVCGCAT